MLISAAARILGISSVAAESANAKLLFRLLNLRARSPSLLSSSHRLRIKIHTICESDSPCTIANRRCSDLKYRRGDRTPCTYVLTPSASVPMPSAGSAAPSAMSAPSFSASPPSSKSPLASTSFWLPSSGSAIDLLRVPLTAQSSHLIGSSISILKGTAAICIAGIVKFDIRLNCIGSTFPGIVANVNTCDSPLYARAASRATTFSPCRSATSR